MFGLAPLSSRLPKCLVFRLIFLLTALPTKLFLAFAVVYSCSHVLPVKIRQPGAGPEEVRSLASRLSNFFWSNCSVLILPFAFRGLAFLLHASSSCIYDLSNRIPVQNAAIAVMIEGIWLSVPYLKMFHVLHFNETMAKIRFIHDTLLAESRLNKLPSVAHPISRKATIIVFSRLLVHPTPQPSHRPCSLRIFLL